MKFLVQPYGQCHDVQNEIIASGVTTGGDGGGSRLRAPLEMGRRVACWRQFFCHVLWR